MRRRKLLIGIGAAAAGGSAAFGTEAFTSVQAERNVDVAVAGDRSSFVAIEPLSSDNAGKYVNTESDDTVELELDGDNSGSGEGVTQDAVTQLENLFRVVNQGSQEVSVYFEDDSDAVTFRVSGSADGFSGSGQSLEGPDNSADLEVGEQVVVGMTIDTLNNDVSGQLLDSVVLYADANPSAPEQDVPDPQYVVDGDGDDPNTFADLSSAITSGEIESDAVVGIDAAAADGTIFESSKIDISTNGVTVTGFNGRPTIDRDVQDGAFIEASGDGVTIQNIEITEDVTGAGFGGERSLLASGSGVTIDGVRVENQDSGSPKGNPTIATTGEDTTITNCESINAPISANGASGSLTLTNNYIEDVLTEGIFSFGSTAGEIDFTIENNEVVNHNINRDNSKEIKIVDDPASVNGETDQAAQIESLLTENSVNSVQLNGDSGTRVTPDIVGSGEQFANVNEVLKPGLINGSAGGSSSTSALVVLFEDGEYGSLSDQIFDSAITHDRDGAVIKGLSKPTVTYTGMAGGSTDVEFAGDDVIVQDLDLVFTNDPDEQSVEGEPFLDFAGQGGTARNVDVTYDPNATAGGPTGYVSVSGSGTITFEDCTFSDTTSGGSNRYVSANGLYDNGGTFELLDCVFNDGTRTDANVGSSGTAVYKNNQFNATPAGGSDSITGSMSSGGEFDITGNNFTPSTELLFTSHLDGTVNGETGENEELAQTLSDDNGGVGVNVNSGGTVVN